MKKTTKISVREKIPDDELTVSKFIALPDSEKERIYQEIDSMTPEELYATSRPLNAQERAQWKRIQKNIRRGRGRPKVGKGVAKVSLSVEPFAAGSRGCVCEEPQAEQVGAGVGELGEFYRGTLKETAGCP